MVSFSIFSLLTWYPFIISYSSIPSFKYLQPLSIFLFQITHASLFLLVHTGIYHHHTSMSSCHSLSLASILLSPSVSLLPHIPICKTFISWTFFHLYILFLPFCIIKSIFPYLFANLPYSTTDLLLPEFPISSLISPSHSSSLLSTR